MVNSWPLCWLVNFNRKMLITNSCLFYFIVDEIYFIEIFEKVLLIDGTEPHMEYPTHLAGKYVKTKK